MIDYDVCTIATVLTSKLYNLLLLALFGIVWVFACVSLHVVCGESRGEVCVSLSKAAATSLMHVVISVTSVISEEQLW